MNRMHQPTRDMPRRRHAKCMVLTHRTTDVIMRVLERVWCTPDAGSKSCSRWRNRAPCLCSGGYKVRISSKLPIILVKIFRSFTQSHHVDSEEGPSYSGILNVFGSCLLFMGNIQCLKYIWYHCPGFDPKKSPLIKIVLPNKIFHYNNRNLPEYGNSWNVEYIRYVWDNSV